MKGRRDVTSNCTRSGIKSYHCLQTIGSVHKNTSTQHRETISELRSEYSVQCVAHSVQRAVCSVQSEAANTSM